MLSKLGWNKGETLGKSQAGGLLEPVRSYKQNLNSEFNTINLFLDKR